MEKGEKIIIVCGIEQKAIITQRLLERFVYTPKILETKNATLGANQVVIIPESLENEIETIDFSNIPTLPEIKEIEYIIPKIEQVDPRKVFENIRAQHHKRNKEQIKYRSWRLSKQTTLKRR